MGTYKLKHQAIGVLALGLMAYTPALLQAATATATATQSVILPITIAQVSDLDFGTAVQGDIAKTVAPGTAEDAENASFTVTGEPSTAYTITLPANGVVTMSGSNGGTIAVNDFVSFPAAGGGNTLPNTTGTVTLFVGATRAALGAGQTTGSYSGIFTVEVVY